ncbi:site-specific DNA-methyltransferase [Sandarakinorhabdus sp.]|uniref:site-specific DNA-methyltransferase n=1 Tax=Sandarakinorhabdus sp. TaxID=1916663 RepID=UPI003340E245
MTNRLYYGDNLDWLSNEKAFPDASADLVYLDPPFNSNATYSQLFKSPDGKTADSQIEAFEDTWNWGVSAEAAYDRVIKGHNTDVAQLLSAMRSFLHDNALMAYLAMMAARLVELHRVLKPTGSLYLHCDPTASHYLKLLLDGVFGPTGFKTEISWRRQSAHNDAAQGRKQYGNVRDIIFFYTKSESWTWNWQFTAYDESYVKSFYRHTEEGTGRKYRLGDITAPGGANPQKRNPHYEFLGVTRYWRYSKERMQELYEAGRIIQTGPGRVPQYKRYLDEMPGVALQNDWDDVLPLHGSDAERLGYPTQKPLALLERIIAASSNPGDVVLDPFCGCGTAVHAAEKLGRRWIGIDITHLSIALIEKRMMDAFPGIAFEVEGRPKDLDSAMQLALRDKHEFQKWAVTHIGGQPWKGGKKGPDGGIDGLIFFNGFDGDKATHEKAIISVKGGLNKNVNDVASLVETIGREKAALGILLAAALPTKQMEARAAAAGFYDPGTGTPVPRIQIITLAELFAGKRPVIPNVNPAMFKAAPVEAKEQGKLF